MSEEQNDFEYAKGEDNFNEEYEYNYDESANDEQKEIDKQQQLSNAVENSKVLEIIHEMIVAVSEKYLLNQDQAFELLMNYHWNYQQLDRLLQKDNVNLDQKDDKFFFSHLNVVYPIESDIPRFCKSCKNILPVIKLGCLHQQCQLCIQDEIKNEFIGNQSILVFCKDPQCEYQMPFSMIQMLATKEDLEQALLHEVIVNSPYFMQCQAPNCNKILQWHIQQQQIAICACQREYCFKCKSENHQPISCQMKVNWENQQIINESTIRSIKDQAKNGNLLLADRVCLISNIPKVFFHHCKFEEYNLKQQDINILLDSYYEQKQKIQICYFQDECNVLEESLSELLRCYTYLKWMICKGFYDISLGIVQVELNAYQLDNIQKKITQLEESIQAVIKIYKTFQYPDQINQAKEEFKDLSPNLLLNYAQCKETRLKIQ